MKEGASSVAPVAGESRERLAAIGEIATEIAHELRNVLQIISASAYLARQDPAASAPHLAKIERNARVAHAIVDDLMALARGDAVHAEPTAFVDLLSAARADLVTTNVVWVDEVTPSALQARLHAGLFTRVLHVLYDNSIAVTAPRAPTITTRARLERVTSGGSADAPPTPPTGNRQAGFLLERLVVEVADDGPGVPAKIAEHLFTPLFTGREGGTGLGLALARRIVAAHGGTIVLVPCPAGATFRIELPST